MTPNLQTNVLPPGAPPGSQQRLVKCPSITHLDLFSGIGGFALAAQAAGFKTIGFSEIEPYASKVLKRHWPTVPNFGDIRNVRGLRAEETHKRDAALARAARARKMFDDLGGAAAWKDAKLDWDSDYEDDV